MDDAAVKVIHCPTCLKRRRFFAWFQDWYGWHFTCLSCGDQWAEGERLTRPFCPGWRKANIDHAKKQMAEWKARQK